MSAKNPATFNPKNPRIRLAKYQHLFHRTPIIIFAILTIIALVCSGTALLILKSPLGWLPLSLITLPCVFIFWVQNALKDIPPQTPTTLTNLLAPDLLIKITENTTSADLVQLLPHVQGGPFIMTRFELPLGLFEQLLPYLPSTPEPIYEKALQIFQKTKSSEITGATLTVALLASIQDHEQLLSRLQLSTDDLHQGIIWYNYLNGLVKDSRKPRHTGGIARDFAFGFTPTLDHFAVNFSARYTGQSHKIQQAENTAILAKIIHVLSHPGRANVALVGAYGSGRSTIVSSLAEILMDADSDIPANLKYNQIYSLDVASLISATKNQGDLEYLLTKIMNEAYSAKNIILCLDHAHLFFEEGPGSIDIANFLTPILESGSLRLILIMDEQRFLEISTKNPSLANSLNKIIVNPTGREETIKILMDGAPYLEHQHNVIYTYRSLTEAYRLSEQYIHDASQPGRARLLLESAVNHSEHGLVTAESVQTAVEKSYGVKVKVADTTAERNKLLHLEQLIHERMIDQSVAVSAVAGALRRAAAGVKNTNRPIGTFLFLGPTGVGKTELAKALAHVYFDGTDSIIRLDMNEYVTSSDVARLIADGATDPESLTAKIMKQPFSVVLLDEIEKAHPSVLTALLQVLDEGILMDAKNREISFRDSIIIATSNAGSSEIRERLSSPNADKADIANFREDLIEKLIVSGEFKPEFLNRFDEICLFKPLSTTDLEQILDLILASTNRTLEPQKISVRLTPKAKQILINRGYDPKMGARPMRRLVQTTVDNIVASAILSGTATPGSVLTITPAELDTTS